MVVSEKPVDQVSLAHLLAAGAVHGTRIVGHPGGWSVVIQYGAIESALCGRNGAARLFRKFETLVQYLKTRGIAQYQVDARGYDPVAAKSMRTYTTASFRMRQIHQTASEAKKASVAGAARD